MVNNQRLKLIAREELLSLIGVSDVLGTLTALWGEFTSFSHSHSKVCGLFLHFLLGHLNSHWFVLILHTL